MLSVHGRHDRKLIILNKLSQPVGPSNDVMIELSIFLGTLARNATLCPLDIENWKLMDTKDNLWDYTKVSSIQFYVTLNIFKIYCTNSMFKFSGEI